MGEVGSNHSGLSGSTLRLKQGHSGAQWGVFHNLPGQLLSHLLSKVPPCIQVEFLVYQFLPIASCPVDWHHWEETENLNTTV